MVQILLKSVFGPALKLAFEFCASGKWLDSKVIEAGNMVNL